MTEDSASQTAEYMALFRALESARPRRIRVCDDARAIHFLRPAFRRAVTWSRLPLLGALVRRYVDWRRPGARTSGVARTRLIDDVVDQALRDGIPQVAILGSGFDCRAHRLPAMHATTVFEVDIAATHAAKRARLERASTAIPPNVRAVDIDFNRQGLADVLEHAGFDRRRRSLILWEGVTNYLSADAVDGVLRFVASCAEGSRLVFTYVHRAILDGSQWPDESASLLRDVARMGEPWTFGLHPDELSGFLAARGLQLQSDLGAREYRMRYFGPEGERMKGYDFYHVAVATVRRHSDAEGE